MRAPPKNKEIVNAALNATILTSICRDWGASDESDTICKRGWRSSDQTSEQLGPGGSAQHWQWRRHSIIGSQLRSKCHGQPQKCKFWEKSLISTTFSECSDVLLAALTWCHSAYYSGWHSSKSLSSLNESEPVVRGEFEQNRSRS